MDFDFSKLGVSPVRSMEIRVYLSLESRQKGESLFCARVECPDSFSFEKSLVVFRSIYGSNVIIEFLCV